MSLTSSARRLATMDGEELRFRLRCEGRKAAQRVRHAVSAPRWKRARLESMLGPATSSLLTDARNSASQGDFLTAHRLLGRHFCSRSSAWPIAAAARDRLVPLIQARFSGAATEAASRADAIADGRYDLLGYRDVAWGVPPDWHRDPINHARAPQTFWGTIRYLDPVCGDHKVIWELNRHQHWRMLGRAYWLTRKDLYRAVFLSELESWLESNPPGTGINWASMLELGFRGLSWTWAVEFFCDGTDRDETPWLVDLLVALDRQLDQVAHGLSRYFSPNTHLTGEALALYAVSTAFPELRKSRARQELGRRVLLRESTRQVNLDGGHAELSAHYHRYSTDFYLLALLVARASNDPAADRFEEIVRLHARYLRAIADDRGRLPLLGDDDGGQLFGICGGRPADAAPTLSAIAAALNDPTLAVAPADEEVHWILGRRPAVSLEPEGRSSWPSQALLSSGYFVSRNRRGDHLVLDAGAHGYLSGGHSHSDALSIVLAIDGKPVLVDPGTATYTIDSALRDAFRSTRMHNTVVIDGSDHVAPRGPFQWTGAPTASVLSHRIDAGVDFVQATHNAYAGAAHVRSIFAVHGSGWIVIDHVFGGGEQTAEGYWHLHPMWRPDIRGQQVMLHDGKSPGPAIVFTSPVAAICAAPLALFSPEYGRIESSCTLRTTERQRAPFVMGTFVSAVPGHGDIQIRRLAIEEPLPDPWLGAALSITSPHGDLLILSAARPDPAQAEPDCAWGPAGVRTDARAVALLRTNAGWRPLSLVDGEQLFIDLPARPVESLSRAAAPALS
jgi:hypothetical protein